MQSNSIYIRSFVKAFVLMLIRAIYLNALSILILEDNID